MRSEKGGPNIGKQNPYAHRRSENTPVAQSSPVMDSYSPPLECEPSSEQPPVRTSARLSRLVRAVQPYGIALCSTLIAIALRHSLSPLWGDNLPFITLYPAVFLSAWYGGLGPGLLSTFLGIGAAAYLWMAPFRTFAVDGFADWLGLLVAMGLMGLITSLTATLRRTQEELEARVAARTAELAQANAALQNEVRTRLLAEDSLRVLNVELDQRVQERTAALAESEERFATLFHASPIPMTLLSINDGCFHDINQATLHESGYSRAELVGQVITTLPVFANPLQLVELGRLLQEPHNIPGADLRLRSKAGVERDYLAYANVITLQGQPYLLGAMIDVTQRKQAEEALARHTQELTHLHADLRQIAYVTAHDLQEPARQMSVYAQMLAQRSSSTIDTLGSDAISFIVKASQRMAAQLSDLMHYLEVEGTSTERTTTDCELVLQRALAQVWEPLTVSGATITHDPLPTLSVHPRHLQLVFQELLDNAIKFRHTAPLQVHISAERSDASWRFMVRDNGIGIDPAHIGKLFGFFKRIEPDQYPGTGMGLAICKKIIERHNGRIWIESTLGNGTAVLFTIGDEHG